MIVSKIAISKLAAAGSIPLFSNLESCGQRTATTPDAKSSAKKKTTITRALSLKYPVNVLGAGLLCVSELPPPAVVGVL